MAQNEIRIDASSKHVFDVLSDGRNYGYWVVGSSEIRDVDDSWPATGARFAHTVGVGPLKLPDHTEVMDSRPPTYLRLRARARPLGTVMVTLELEAPGPNTTRVVMTEDAADPLTRLTFNPLTHRLVYKRNKESLRRLKELAEGRGPAPEDARRA